jgi:hypothetical protein
MQNWYRVQIGNAQHIKLMHSWIAIILLLVVSGDLGDVP